MMSIISIVLRVALVGGLLVAFVGPLIATVSPSLKKIGFSTALAALVLLVCVRIGMRVFTPEDVPSFSG